MKGEVLDPICKSSCNEALLNEGAILEGTLTICLQKLQLLGNVGTFLVVLMVLMHVSEESQVIKVIDSILKDGVCCLVSPKVTVEPGGQRLHGLVRGVIRGSIQFDDSHLLLSLGSAVESSDPSIVELLNEAGEPLCPVVKGNCEIWEMLLVLLVPRWAFAEAIVFIVHPLLKYCNVGLEPLNFLPMDIVSDPDGGSKPSDNGIGLGTD